MEERARNIFSDVCALLAARMHSPALLRVEDVRLVCPTDECLMGCVEVVKQVIVFDKAYHVQGLRDPGPPASRGHRRRPPVYPTCHTGVMAFQGGGNPAENVTLEKHCDVCECMCKQLIGMLPQETRVFTNLVFDICNGARLYANAVSEMAHALWTPLLTRRRIFIVPGALRERLLWIRTVFEELVDVETLFAEPFKNLALEVEFLEAYFASELKVSLLKGGDAFAELVKANSALSRYLGKRARRLHRGDTGNSAARTMTSLFSGSSPMSSMLSAGRNLELPRRLSGSFGIAGLLVSSVAPCPVEVDYTRLEQRYMCMNAHLREKLQLLCGGGLAAAARFGGEQVMDMTLYEDFVSVHSYFPAAAGPTPVQPLDKDQPYSTKCPTPQVLSSGALSGSLPRCDYVESLAKLAEIPGVAFVGIFANMQQLPHLASSGRASHLGPASMVSSIPTGCPFAAPLYDSNWIVSASPPEDDDVGGARKSAAASAAQREEFDWWAMAFVGIDPKDSSDQNPSPPSDASEQTSRKPTLCGLEALDAWQCQPELEYFRTALTQACRERHSVEMFDRFGAYLSPNRIPFWRRLAQKSPQTSPYGPRPGRCRNPASTRGSRRRASSDGQMSPLALPSPVRSRGGSSVDVAVSVGPCPDIDCLFDTRYVNAPRGATIMNFHVHRGSQTHPATSLVMPLDMGWFPAPLFLGLVLRDPGPEHYMPAEPKYTPPTLQRNHEGGYVFSGDIGVTRGLWEYDAATSTIYCVALRKQEQSAWHQLRDWWRNRGQRPVPEPHHDDPTENSDSTEEQLVRLAYAISGRRFRKHWAPAYIQ